MPALSRLRRLAFAARVAAVLATAAASQLPGAGDPSSTVGDLGRKEALVFEGNTTFPSDRLYRGLVQHLDFHLASHPAASLSEYTAFLSRRLLLGYRHEGFPKVTVTTTVDDRARQILVRIHEGPRCYCGDIRLNGVPSMTTREVRRKLVEGLTVPGDGSQTATSAGAPMWSPSDPAPFDELTATNLTTQIVVALAELNYLAPKVTARVVADTVRRKGHLEIEIASEGIKGVIDQIEVTGNRTNSTRQVLDFLQIRPGTEVRARMVDDITHRLWNAGRFLRHEATLNPLSDPGKFRLDIRLEELPAAPPLDRDLTPVEQALLKLREWLLAWETRDQDLVVSGSARAPAGGGSLECVLSPASGFAVCLRSATAEAPLGLSYAAVVSREVAGLYSVWRRGKFESSGSTNVGLEVFFRLLPTPEGSSEGRFSMSLGAGFSTGGDADRPIELSLDVAPAGMIHLAHRTNVSYSIANGVLTCRDQQPADGVPGVLEVKVATGRLIRALQEGDQKGVHTRTEFRFQEGAFSQTLEEIKRASGAHTNTYRADGPYGAFFAHVFTDLLESSVLESPLLQSSAATNFGPAKVQAALRQARTILDQHRLDKLFAPLQDLLTTVFPPAPAGDDAARAFAIPLDPALLRLTQQNMVALVAPHALAATDSLWPRGSWPWTLTREAILVVVGGSRYTGDELQKLYQSNQTGPLADLAVAHLLGRNNMPAAQAFARKGREALTSAGFRRDYRILLEGEAVASRFLVRGLELLRELSDDQLASLATAAHLDPEDAALLRQTVIALRAAGGKSTPDALWPVIEQHWESSLRPHLQTWLDRFSADANAEQGAKKTNPEQ